MYTLGKRWYNYTSRHIEVSQNGGLFNGPCSNIGLRGEKQSRRLLSEI